MELCKTQQQLSIFGLRMPPPEAESQQDSSGVDAYGEDLLVAMALLAERLLGQGLFRRFLEASTGRSASAAAACAHGDFLTAAAAIIRCGKRLSGVGSTLVVQHALDSTLE